MVRVYLYSFLAALAFVTISTAAPSPTYLYSDAGASLGEPSLDAGAADSGDLSTALDSVAPVSSSQAIPQQSVQLGSDTEIVPVTGVFPQVLYQPAIQIADPIISDLQTYGGYEGDGDYGGDYGGLGLGPVDGTSAGDDPMFKRRQLGVPGGSGGPISSISGTPSTMSTDTLIQPIVSIQPHAYEPVPVPVSQPYNYPVPVGVSVPVSPAPVFPFGGFNRFDYHHSGFDDGCGFDGGFFNDGCGFDDEDCDEERGC